MQLEYNLLIYSQGNYASTSTSQEVFGFHNNYSSRLNQQGAKLQPKRSLIARCVGLGPVETGSVLLGVDRSNVLQLGCNWFYWEAKILS